jgi:RecB family exonuclease
MSEPLPNMPRRLFPCTPSRLSAFDCPRRYRFTYLDRPRPKPGPPWAHNSLGAAVHTALARWWSLPRAKRTPDEGERLTERAWTPLGFKDDAQSQRYRDVSARWVRDYLAEHANPDDEPIGVERTVAAPTRRLALSGRVDRIDERGGADESGAELVVVDYKTGRGGVSEDDARSSLALAMYVVGVRRSLRRPCRRVELHHLPSGEIASVEHSEQALQRHVARAEATADDIVAATDTLQAGADPDDVFPAVPGPRCSWCDFRAHCPQGQAASQPVSPWAALPAL